MTATELITTESTELAMQKRCSKCGEIKELAEFSRDSSGIDYRRGRCKVCVSVEDRLYRKKNADRLRVRTRLYHEKNTEEVLAKDRLYRKKNAEKILASDRLYRLRYPERCAAKSAVQRAIRSGDLTRPQTCEVCGRSQKLQAHHEDYSRPLEVHWICSRCHMRHHAGDDILAGKRSGEMDAANQDLQEMSDDEQNAWADHYGYQ
jgi:ribosomal protein S27AE